jgi:hypothetical protein
MKSMYPITLLLLASTSSAAENFDGSLPMTCEPVVGHDCLPKENSCKQLQPEAGKDLTLRIDVSSKTLRTPYRTDALPIQTVGKNRESLTLQGTSLELVWSATVHRTNGKLTLAIADREGAYVIFGQCKVAGTKSEASNDAPARANVALNADRNEVES